MSGLKYSEYSFAQVDAQERTRLLAQIQAARDLATGIEQQVKRALGNASGGFRSAVAELERTAMAWIERTTLMSRHAAPVSFSSDRPIIEQRLAEWQWLSAEGRQTYVALLDALTNRLPRQKHALADRLTRIGGTLDAQRGLIDQWLGTGPVEALEQEIAHARQALGADSLADAAAATSALEPKVEQAVAEAAQKEAEQFRQDQGRQMLMVERELTVLQRQIAQRLEAASDGLRATFPEPVQLAQQWLARANEVQSNSPSDPDAAGVATIQAASEQLRAALDAGRGVSGALEQTFVVEAERLRAPAEARLSALAVLLDGHREQLARWNDPIAISALDDSLGAARRFLGEDRFLDVQAPCEALEKSLQALITDASQLDEKDQKRQYLLDSLRQTCSSLGFAEVGKGGLKREGDYRSPYNLTMDTFDHGHVTFHLSLDSIQADSRISATNCFAEFDALTEQLREKFGIETDFVPADGTPRPHKRAVGTLDLPRGGKSASAR